MVKIAWICILILFASLSEYALAQSGPRVAFANKRTPLKLYKVQNEPPGSNCNYSYQFYYGSVETFPPNVDSGFRYFAFTPASWSNYTASFRIYMVGCTEYIENIGEVPVDYDNTIAIDILPEPILSATGNANSPSGAVLSVTQYAPSYSAAYVWYRDDELWPSCSGPSCTTIASGMYKVKIYATKQGTISAFTNEIYVGSTIKLNPNPPNTLQNFTVDNSFLVPQSQLPGSGELASDLLAQSVVYTDGLGRTIQSVSTASSTTSGDIISSAGYDAEGRSTRNSLSYVIAQPGNSGKFRPSHSTEQTSFYTAPPTGILANTKPYSEMQYDKSPLDRVLKSDLPSSAWSISNTRHSSSLITRYSGSPQMFRTIYNSGTGLMTVSSAYAVGELVVSTSTNAQGDKSCSYSDLSGRLIAAGSFDGIAWNYSFYVYDEFDRMVRTFSPEAFSFLNSSWDESLEICKKVLANYALQYKYDDQGQVISKLVPGKSFQESYIYFKNGLLAFTQSANDAELTRHDVAFNVLGKASFSFVRYDINGRVCQTGDYVIDSLPNETRTQRIEALRTLIANATAPEFVSRFKTVNHEVMYSNYWIPFATYNSGAAGSTIEAIHFYDDYRFDRDNNIANDPSPAASGEYVPSSRAQFFCGMKTGTKTRLLTGREADTGYYEDVWLHSLDFYDDQYRPVEHQEDSWFTPTIPYGTGNAGIFDRDKVSRSYKFLLLDAQGRVIKQRTSVFDNSVNETEQFQYAGRQLYRVVRLKPTGRHEVQARYRYNEFGQLIQKALLSDDSISYTQYVDFKYNNLGWPLAINQSDLSPAANPQGDMFGQEFFYESLPTYAPSDAIARYDGKVSFMRYQDKVNMRMPGDTQDHDHNWHFAYDGMGRMTKGTYSRAPLSGGTRSSCISQGYYLEEMAFNKNSATTALKRTYKGTLVDDIVYRRTDAQGFVGSRLLNAKDHASVANQTLHPSVVQFVEFSSSETATEFAYAKGGNVISDANRTLKITYNRQDVVSKIEVNPSAPIFNAVENYHDATGRKLLQFAWNGTGNGGSYSNTFYSMGATMMLPSIDQATYSIQLTEAYVYDGESRYTITDLLGTPRITFAAGAIIKERNHYTPTGMRLEALSSAALGLLEGQWAYAGGERLPEEMGLLFQVHGQRVLDVALSQWHAVEPEIERYSSVSPYSYVGGDPVNRNDPTGRSWGAWGGTWVDYTPWSGDEQESRLSAFDPSQGNRRYLDRLEAVDLEDRRRYRVTYSDGTTSIQFLDAQQVANMFSKFEDNLRNTVLAGNSPSEAAKSANHAPDIVKGALQDYFTGLAKFSPSLTKTIAGLDGQKIWVDQLDGPGQVADLGRTLLGEGGRPRVNVFLEYAIDGEYDNRYDFISTIFHEQGHVKLLGLGVDDEENHYRAFLHQTDGMGRDEAGSYFAGTSERYKRNFGRQLKEQFEGHYGLYNAATMRSDYETTRRYQLVNHRLHSYGLPTIGVQR